LHKKFRYENRLAIPMKIYPLQFTPIFKERIWGGTKLKTVLNKEIPEGKIGESWELSTVPGDISVVANGIYKNQNLNELIQQYPETVLGKKVIEKFGGEFPLLFKFLDAREDLSIQVHPNDALAKKRHNSFGKTEMWYVMQADKQANLIVGFKENSSQEEYIAKLNDKDVLSLLDTHQVKKGDVFFLETGTVHAIGAGNVIAEIQQTSDITYRIYDFDRVDDKGNTRELHTELALDAINYQKTDSKVIYSEIENNSNEVVHCPFFTTHIIPLDGKMEIQKNQDSFVVYMCVEGSFAIKYNDEVFDYKLGETILLPAALDIFELKGKGKLLEIYIS